MEIKVLDEYDVRMIVEDIIRDERRQLAKEMRQKIEDSDIEIDPNVMNLLNCLIEVVDT